MVPGKKEASSESFLQALSDFLHKRSDEGKVHWKIRGNNTALLTASVTSSFLRLCNFNWAVLPLKEKREWCLHVQKKERTELSRCRWFIPHAHALCITVTDPIANSVCTDFLGEVNSFLPCKAFYKGKLNDHSPCLSFPVTSVWEFDWPIWQPKHASSRT